ncbi:FG-GAP repeat protein [Luteolibacter marinus]|uniref:FG-GAP repeat protein n=1 Tax=Luteolibacter marinus TaxID=2776705 RepID=UPI0018677E90|nr:FG-GAP repeat protein [Luteolibacter marinus]
MKFPVLPLVVFLLPALRAATFSQNILPPAGRDFSGNVAASGNFMAVSGGGRVFFYERNGGTWEIFARKNFITTPAANGGAFGTRILMPDRDTLVVSDPSFDAPTPAGGTNADQGAVFVFDRDVGGDNNWGLIRQITATDHQLPNGNLSKRLGEAMAIDHGRLVVSAAAGTAIGNPKFFYVFEKDRGGANQWGQVPGAKMEGSALSGLSFGNAVAITGDLIVIGSYLENRQATPTSPIESGYGALYFFRRNEGGTDHWGLPAGGRRYAPDGAPADFFGHSISLSGDRMAVGAGFRDLSPTQQDAGTVYILERHRGGTDAWGFTADRIHPPDAAAGDGFGASVRLVGNLLVGSSPGDDVAGTNNAGSVNLFVRSAGSWTPVPDGRLSIDTIPGITKVDADLGLGMHLDARRLFLYCRYSSTGRLLADIDISADFPPDSIGSLKTLPNGGLRFLADQAGTFQLRSSSNLRDWTNVGATFSALPGTPVDFPNSITPGVPRRFHRIEER